MTDNSLMKGYVTGPLYSVASTVAYPYVLAGRATIQVTKVALQVPVQVSHYIIGDKEQSNEPTSSVSDGETASSTTSSDDSIPLYSTDEEGENSIEEIPSSSSSSSSNSSDENDVESIPSMNGYFLLTNFPGVQTASWMLASSTDRAYRTISASGALVNKAGSASLSASSRLANGVVDLSYTTAKRCIGTCVDVAGFSIQTASNVAVSSATIASHVVPVRVKNAVYEGVQLTGRSSNRLLARSISFPMYRTMILMSPSLVGTEDQLTNSISNGISLMVEVFGPQNAFYITKFVYETITSDTTLDVLRLGKDIVNEATTSENYEPVVNQITQNAQSISFLIGDFYNMLPAGDEMEDMIQLSLDLASEVINSSSRNEGQQDCSAVWSNECFESPKCDTSNRFEYIEANECVDNQATFVKSKDERLLVEDTVFSEGFTIPNSPEHDSVNYGNYKNIDESSQCLDSVFDGVLENDALKNTFNHGVDMFSNFLDSEEVTNTVSGIVDIFDAWSS